MRIESWGAIGRRMLPESAGHGVARGDGDAADDGRRAQCARDCDQISDPVRILHEPANAHARMRDGRDQERR